MHKLLTTAAMLVALIARAMSAENITDGVHKDSCLQYDKEVTLTGTVHMGKVDFGTGEPAWWSGSSPLLTSIKQFAHRVLKTKLRTRTCSGHYMLSICLVRANELGQLIHVCG